MSSELNATPPARPTGIYKGEELSDLGPYTILLVDDNLTFVASVRHFLNGIAGVSVVDHAVNGVQALRKAQMLRPDLVLLDISMPVMDGLEVAAKMQAWPRVPTIVFLSMNDNNFYLEAAKQAGALGFVSKSNFVTDLVPLLDQLVTLRNLKATL